MSGVNSSSEASDSRNCHPKRGQLELRSLRFPKPSPKTLSTRAPKPHSTKHFESLVCWQFKPSALCMSGGPPDAWHIARLRRPTCAHADVLRQNAHCYDFPLMLVENRNKAQATRGEDSD